MAIDFTKGINALLLAGLGALATSVEKSQEILDSLVKKGELTVEQGKVLNEELKRTVKRVHDEHKDKKCNEDDADIDTGKLTTAQKRALRDKLNAELNDEADD